MNAQGSEQRIRKILVAMDASPHSLAALQASAELAGSLNAKLTGLFIEDIALFRLAELPFAREVSFFTPGLRRVEPVHLERQLRAQAERMRALLADYADRQGISYEFRVVRGAVTSEVMAAAAGADLMVLGKRGRSLARKMGSTARFIISQGRGMLLILEHGHPLDMPVAVLFDGSPVAEKAMEAAVHLVMVKNAPLTVFILAAEKDPVQEIQMAAMRHLHSHELAANFRVVVSPTESKLRHLIRLEGGGPVVIPLGDGPFHGDQLREFVTEIPNPVLLVR